MITLTNLNAMRSAAAMAESNADIKTSMERLSTGSRINAASDDAAGLAISERMRTQILGLSKAITNGADAIGLLSTADGALVEVSSLLQRMRELSLQSANGTGTAEDRKHLNAEYQRLKDEIDRIGSQTQWNGMNIFDGLLFPGVTQFQVGANASQTIEIEIQELNSRTLAELPMAVIGSPIDAPGAGERFGDSVSISGDGSMVAVSAENADKTRIYRLTTSGWIQIGSDITSANPQPVSISDNGSTVAIGGKYGGDTRVFKYDPSSSTWVQLGSSIDLGSGNFSLQHVSLSDDGLTLAVGRPDLTGPGIDRGTARVYRYDAATSDWVASAVFNGAANGDQFGWAVSLSGDGSTVAIGSIKNDGGGGTDRGSVQIYRYDDASSAWQSLGLFIYGENSGDLSGYSISLNDDGTRVVIGAINNDDGGGNSGHSRVYGFNDATSAWEQVGSDIGGEAANDWSGQSVSISGDGNTVVVGAVGNDGGASNSGHARIYEYDAVSSDWVQQGADIDGTSSYEYLGSSVSISADGSTVAIGAPNARPNGGQDGQVTVYAIKNLAVSQVASQPAAAIAIELIDKALSGVLNRRANFGSTINRLNHAIANLSNALVNTESSESRIADADYAKESSNLASAQIRNQGAKAMLAQANTDQQLTLSLLEDWL